MHRLFLGCNLWSSLFLTAAVVSGWSGATYHVRLAIFGAVFACLVQSGVIALFLGAAKLAKEHVGRFNMPLAIIERINEVYHRLFPMAAVGAALTAAAAILGGLAHVGRVAGWAHGTLATGAWLYLLGVIPLEFKLQSRMHGVILEVERHMPASEEAADARPHPDYRPDNVVLDRAGRAKALLYIGLTIPMPYLGYTFIVGRDVSFLLIPTVLLTAACLGAAWHQHRAARHENQS